MVNSVAGTGISGSVIKNKEQGVPIKELLVLAHVNRWSRLRSTTERLSLATEQLRSRTVSG